MASSVLYRVLAIARAPVRCVRGSLRARALHPPERAHLQRFFGGDAGEPCSIDLDALRIAAGGHPLDQASAWQPYGAFIQFHDRFFEGGRWERELLPSAYPILCHEAFHVWQRVHRRERNVSLDGLVLGVTRGRRAYAYDTSITDPDEVLARFLSPSTNIEAQARMFEHSTLTPRDPKWLRLSAYVRRPPRPEAQNV